MATEADTAFKPTPTPVLIRPPYTSSTHDLNPIQLPSLSIMSFLIPPLSLINLTCPPISRWGQPRRYAARCPPHATSIHRHPMPSPSSTPCLFSAACLPVKTFPSIIYHAIVQHPHPLKPLQNPLKHPPRENSIARCTEEAKNRRTTQKATTQQRQSRVYFDVTREHNPRNSHHNLTTHSHVTRHTEMNPTPKRTQSTREEIKPHAGQEA